ncbi:hypothetical protein [Emcibacter sp. SYSU 3D8]|uniref:hypothetical protein n=1 Tax=Emcibacter sp. SYSU 3D8 TaxID=3133969 RepID=UPI0031FF1809
MFGKTLVSVLVVAVLGAGLVFVVVRGLDMTDQKFNEIEAEFHGQCVAAFNVHVSKAAGLCTCLWEEVRGESRMEMLRRLRALQTDTAGARDRYMARISNKCAQRLHIERR